MATSKKKAVKKPKAKTSGPKESRPKQTQVIEQLKQERDEALEQLAAASDILRTIARGPADRQLVLDAIAESAAKLCDAADAAVWRVDGDVIRQSAHFGPIAIQLTRGEGYPITRDTPPTRAVVDRQTIHVHDLRAAESEFPGSKTLGIASGLRTVLATPLLRDGLAIGSIQIRRTEVRPFTERQIKLLETFADQAVIAIENVRLFQELNESLEQQTATSEILGVIASSPTDIQPVLETITERAARVCGAEDGVLRLLDGNVMRLAAHYGSVPGVAVERPINRQSPPGRAVLDRKIIHIADPVEVIATEYPDVVEVGRRMGARDFTVLAVPLMREDVVIGVIHFRRPELRPFTDKQIALVKIFADQAVIAIENVRLFKEIQERNAELREALEHQTATSEVLGIISRSPTDVQPVLDAIVESAARVCGIDDVVLRLCEGDALVPRAHFGPIPTVRVEISMDEPRQRWINEHGTLHVPDVREQGDIQMVDSTGGRWRTLLAAPLRQRGKMIGTLGARRIEVRPFTPAQIKLLETFADQAVIAIENVRLFKEIQERNRDLTEALEQQTATSKILEVIASSPTDIQPVLEAIAESATRLCDAYDAGIGHVVGDILRLNAHSTDPSRRRDVPITRGHIGGEAILDRRTVHIHDLAAEENIRASSWINLGVRTVLFAPLLREGTAIGAIALRRMEVRPFTEKQIALLETFANQAVIAIENVRLFKELQERNAELH